MKIGTTPVENDKMGPGTWIQYEKLYNDNKDLNQPGWLSMLKNEKQKEQLKAQIKAKKVRSNMNENLTMSESIKIETYEGTKT